MRSSALRVTVVALVLIAFAAAAAFLFNTERQIAASTAALRAFDRQARDASDALGDARASEQAYVAAGQGVAFWMSKVSATADAVTSSVDSLRRSASSANARAALDEAAATVAEFTAVDRRSRDYLISSEPRIAGDVIFTEGAERAAASARQIESARLAEHQDFDAFEAQLRRQQAMAAAGAGAFTIFAVLLLAPIRRQAPTADSEDARVDRADPSMLALNLPREERLSIPRSTSVGPVMRTAADLATEFGRVRDLQDLGRLLGRTADLIDASGMVVWIGNASGGHRSRGDGDGRRGSINSHSVGADLYRAAAHRAPHRLDCGLHGALFLVAHDADRDFGRLRLAAIGCVSQRAHEIVARLDASAVDRRDDVARLQPGARCGRSFRHRRDEHAPAHAEVRRQLVGELQNRHAQTAARPELRQIEIEVEIEPIAEIAELVAQPIAVSHDALDAGAAAAPRVRRDLQILLLTVTTHRHPDRSAGRRFLDQSGELASAAHALAVEHRDQVAGLHSGLLGRAVRVNLVDLHAVGGVGDPHADFRSASLEQHEVAVHAFELLPGLRDRPRIERAENGRPGNHRQHRKPGQRHQNAKKFQQLHNFFPCSRGAFSLAWGIHPHAGSRLPPLALTRRRRFAAVPSGGPPRRLARAAGAHRSVQTNCRCVKFATIVSPPG